MRVHRRPRTRGARDELRARVEAGEAFELVEGHLAHPSKNKMDRTGGRRRRGLGGTRLLGAPPDRRGSSAFAVGVRRGN